MGLNNYNCASKGEKIGQSKHLSYSQKINNTYMTSETYNGVTGNDNLKSLNHLRLPGARLRN